MATYFAVSVSSQRTSLCFIPDNRPTVWGSRLAGYLVRREGGYLPFLAHRNRPVLRRDLNSALPARGREGSTPSHRHAKFLETASVRFAFRCLLGRRNPEGQRRGQAGGGRRPARRLPRRRDWRRTGAKGG